MTDCDAMRERMPQVVHGNNEWLPAEATHLGHCEDCTAEWRLVRRGAALHAGLVVDSDRIVARVLSRLREQPVVFPLRRLPWRGFAVGLAAAASIALAIWVPGRNVESVAVVTLPSRIGPSLPALSAVTEDQLERVTLGNESVGVEGVPGAVPHLGELTESDLEQLSHLTESP